MTDAESLLLHLSARETRDSFRGRHTGPEPTQTRSPPRKVTHQLPPRPSCPGAVEPLPTGGLRLTPLKTLVRSAYRPQVVQRVRDHFFLEITNIDTAMRLVTLYAARKHFWRAWNPGLNVSAQDFVERSRTPSAKVKQTSRLYAQFPANHRQSSNQRP